MKKKFKIGLKDNGVHSLHRGLEMFELYESEEDSFQLKEAIMFLHHGIELLMKQVLVERAGEFLIFADLDDSTVKKVINAKRNGISVFDLEKPVHTATYEQAIARIRAFIDNPELKENLEAWLKELNKYRNNLEHYAIDIEIHKIENLIRKIKKPLIDFLGSSLEDFKEKDAAEVEGKWQNTINRITEMDLMEKEVEGIVRKMNGQTVPGELLGTSGMVKLPDVQQLIHDYQVDLGKRRMMVDLLVKDKSSKDWIIEVKAGKAHQAAIQQLLSYFKQVEGIPWLVVFGTVGVKLRDRANEQGVYITDIDEWEVLKGLIEKSGA